MATLEELLRRNRRFAATVADGALTAMPGRPVFVLTCVDPRVEPAAILGVGMGEAVVLRNVGGRVDDAVIADIAFLMAIGRPMGVDEGPPEIALVHHTGCGSAFLADDGFRRAFAERTGQPEGALAARAVTDPVESVRFDVARLIASPLLAGRATVSGHVLRLETGLVESVVEATAPTMSLGSR